MIFRLISLVIILLSSEASAEPEAIRFVVPDFKPFTYLEDGKPAGLGVELVSDALDVLNWPYIIKLVPNYGRALAEVKNGRADGFFLATENLERNQHASLSNTILVNNWSWFYTNNHLASNGDFRSLKRIGTILNTNTHKWLTANNYQVTYTTNDPRQLVELLSKNRLDAVFLAEAVFYEAYVSYKDALDFYQRIESAKPMGVYLSKDYLKKHPDIMPSLNEIITSNE